MLDIIGTNLPERQRELNKHVNEAISKEVDFEIIRSTEEKSDVDRLFKIDVASKYKNIDYIIETIKCGDSLYISRALKCEWLYGDNYSEIINPDYLHHNVFPSMSFKMKKKMLSAISSHVRNEERMLDFYKYCVSVKLEDYALKFLIFTSETHKYDYIENKIKIDSKLDMQVFFGNSFNLIEKYLKQLRSQQMFTKDEIIYFRYLYSVSNEKYLNLFEEYGHQDRYNEPKLGQRLSKQIMTKHKERVLRNPSLYVKNLHMKTIVKYSSVEDAKLYAVALLPDDVKYFWYMDYYETYKSILNLLPFNEIYSFLRQIFMEKYPDKDFEMSKNFYEKKYYKLLTIDERELWALKHLEEEKELFGSGEDYLWYQFISYDLAYNGIKKYVNKTVDRTKRAEIVKVLVSSVRNQRDLKKLTQYYYERHVNEIDFNKQDFLNKIIDLHNIFNVNEACWNYINKILSSMNNFTGDYMSSNKALAIIYYVIHNKEIPSNFHIDGIHLYEIEQYFKPHFRFLNEEQSKLVIDFFKELFCEKIRRLEGREYKNETRDQINNIVGSFLDLLSFFNLTKDDCPDAIFKYVQLEWDNYKDRDLFKEPSEDTPCITPVSLIRLLKQDTTEFLNTLPGAIEKLSTSWICSNLNQLMKKLRIYFSNDLAKNCISIFEAYLSRKDISNNRNLTFTLINGIFHIADNDYKIKFMTKYKPIDSKVAHDTINRKVLLIQEGICRFAYYSRPPVPLPVILQFIKGDYLSFCLPMLNSYVAHLPKQCCIEFISAILDAPVSVQKHGLRLAFRCFTSEDLKNLIMDVWKKTKNVSLRKILYKSLFDYINTMDEDLQLNLYEVFKSCTIDLNEDDDDDVFSLVSCYLPESLKGDYLETAWTAIEKFSEQKSKNIDRKIMVVREIGEHIHCVNKEFCRINILDKIVEPTTFKQNVEMYDNTWGRNTLIYEKWILAVKYIVNFNDEKEMDRSWDLASIIIKKCIELKGNYDIKFTTNRFLMEILQKILKYSCNITNKTQTVPILENIMNLILKSMPMNEIYLLYWHYNVTIISKKVVGPMKIDANGEQTYEHLNTNEIAAGFSDALISFINCLKEKNIYYSSLNAKISDVISNVIDTITYNTDLTRDVLVMCICDLLSNNQAPVTFLLSLTLLGSRYSRYCELGNVSDKVIKFGNEEIITYMNQNFY
ncbi:uncharacterized protein LOC126777618 [Nymphalis io]|uniref:uncharacterized protein LOC126777618 n=1 Tax=Inachis io TaxID=171585 RepID=UPI0021673B14|nr:uncharacterized protein LOC126777618 [Nymphalis io]